MPNATAHLTNNRKEITIRVHYGLKESYKTAIQQGIGAPLPEAVRRANRAGLILACALLVATLLLACAVARASDADDLPVDMHYIAMIESSGCKNLVGDNGKALGCYQLHKGVVIDYNKYNTHNYKHADVMDKEIGLRVASWYMNYYIPRAFKHYGLKDTLENRLTAYNMGIGAVIKGKRATDYINKYNILKGINHGMAQR